MLNYPGYNYGQFNPMLTAQQRLAQMEAQYPQFTQPAQGNQPIGFKTIQVSNINEANATPVDMTGNPLFFYNKGKGEIYLKQFNLQDDSAIFQTYRLTQNPTGNESISTGVNMSEKQYMVLNDKLDALYSMLANKTEEQPKKEVRNNAK